MSAFNRLESESNLARQDTTRRNFHVIAALLRSGAVTRNECALLKALAVRGDERCNFIVRKFAEKRIATEGFIEQISDLICDESFALFSSLFEDCSLEHGKNLSKSERKEKNLCMSALTYGEIDYFSFYRVLRKLNLPRKVNCKFYDLGSGTSKAVFAARITQDFTECVGIEILTTLHGAGLKVLEKYNNEYRSFLYSGQKNDVQLHMGSVLEFDWSDGDVVFANSTCFDASLMAGISSFAEKLKPGSLVITFTKPIVSEKFEQLSSIKFKMSWGPATVYTARRLGEDGSCVPSLGCLRSEDENVNDDGVARFVSSKNIASAPAHFDDSLSTEAETKVAPTSSSTFNNQPLDDFLARFAVPRPCTSGRSSNAEGEEDSSSASEQERDINLKASTSSTITSSGQQDNHHHDLYTIDTLPPSALAAAAGRHIECVFSTPTVISSSEGPKRGVLGAKKPPIHSIKYLLRCPKAEKYRYDASSYVRTPLVVFLHGASARGSHFDGLRSIALPKWLEKETGAVEDRITATAAAVGDFDVPALVLSPLCPQGREWKDADMCEILIRLIDAISAAYSIDTDRIYLTGISMGGLGAWMLAARNSEKFAAVAPMCGGGSPVYARLLRNIPMWFFHCESDNVVSIVETEKLVSQLTTEGAEHVRFTRYSAEECQGDFAAKDWMVGHNCWDRAYSDGEFWSWMMSQRKNIP